MNSEKFSIICKKCSSSNYRIWISEIEGYGLHCESCNEEECFD